jgi:hypothetical protein
MTGPELVISFQPNGTPVAAACSLCGELMAVDSPRPSKPQDAIGAFGEQFKIHIQKKHPEPYPQ